MVCCTVSQTGFGIFSHLLIPRTWHREMLLFDGIKGIVVGGKLFQVKLPFAIDEYYLASWIFMCYACQQ